MEEERLNGRDSGVGRSDGSIVTVRSFTLFVAIEISGVVQGTVKKDDVEDHLTKESSVKLRSYLQRKLLPTQPLRTNNNAGFFSSWEIPQSFRSAAGLWRWRGGGRKPPISFASRQMRAGCRPAQRRFLLRRNFLVICFGNKVVAAYGSGDRVHRDRRGRDVAHLVAGKCF
jgi:hypothetical protein